MKLLVWSNSAEADLYHLTESYADPDTFADFILERIEIAPLILLEHPYLGEAVGDGGLRKWLLRKTPFLLLYRIGNTTIEIVRVIHGATDWRPS